MKKSVVLFVVILMVSLLFMSCGTVFTKGGSDYRSGVSAYEKKEYVSSLRYLNQALSVNPEFVEAAQLFPVVFSEGTSYYKAQISNNAAMQDRQAADVVYRSYTNLQELHEIARISGRSGLMIEDFTSKLEEARLKSGDLWFSYAQSLQAKGDRESLKQAVAAYETARDRNPNLENIDTIIAALIEEATVTVAVIGHGPSNESFSQKVLADVTKILGSDRFIEVIQREDFNPGPDSMVGPLDIAVMTAMGEGWDYVLEVYASTSFEEISKEEPVSLPSGNPLFPGVKRSIGYQTRTYLSYRLFKIKNGVSVVAGDTINELSGPYEYTFSYVQAEGLRELNLGGTGKKNLRYVTSKADDMTTNNAINALRMDYEYISIPAEVSDPTDQTQWIAYYKNQYNDFEEFAEQESGRELFYAIEVVHHAPTDTYFTIGESLDAAIQRSKINSAIMNALSYTARTLAAAEKERTAYAIWDAGEIAAKGVKGLL
jgi:tetratricopeptide (TPR) repeat protein